MSHEQAMSEASLRALAAVIAGLQHAPDGAQAAYRCVDAAVSALGAVRAVAVLVQGGEEPKLVAARGFDDGELPPFTRDAVEAWLDRTLGPGHLRAALPSRGCGLLAAAVVPGEAGDPGLRMSMALLAAALSEELECRDRDRRRARTSGAGSLPGAPRGEDLRLALRGFSHDIRSPLQAVMMQHSLLASGAVGELTDEQQEILQSMREGLNGLRDMARAAWDASRVLGGELDLSPADLNVGELVLDATDVARGPLEARGHVLECVVDDGLEVIADAAGVIRILCALLDNAARFAPPGARITVDGRAASDGVVTLSVSDSGAGVPDELEDTIFDPYVRAARADRAPGNGLGLTVARALARAMQGDLQLERREGRLACFTLRLPAA